MAKRELDLAVWKGYALLAYFGVIPARIAREHLAVNEKVWQEKRRDCEVLAADGRSYLEYQARLLGESGGTSLLYGMRRKKPLTADYNSCEVIAVYNVLRYFGRETSFPELLHQFERNGAALGGAFGTSPSAVELFLREQGFAVQRLVGKKLAGSLPSATQEQVFLICMYNDRASLHRGMHTMCVTGCGNRFLLHNDYQSYGKREFDSLEAAIRSYHGGDSRLWALLTVSPASCRYL